MPPRPALFSVTDSRLPPRFRLRNHSHASAHLCVVLDGAFEERTPHGATWCPARHARYSPPGDVHDLTAAASGARCLIISVDTGSPLHDALPSLRARRYLRTAQLGEALPLLLEVSERPELGSVLESELLVLELFALGARPRRASAGSWVERVREELRATPGHPPSLGELAARNGMHPVSLARGFRRRFGCSIGAYARRLRAEQARRDLLSGEAPISAVAAQCGYADQAHLTRELRRQLGVTPAALQRRVPSIQDPSSRSG